MKTQKKYSPAQAGGGSSSGGGGNSGSSGGGGGAGGGGGPGGGGSPGAGGASPVSLGPDGLHAEGTVGGVDLEADLDQDGLKVGASNDNFSLTGEVNRDGTYNAILDWNAGPASGRAAYDSEDGFSANATANADLGTIPTPLGDVPIGAGGTVSYGDGVLGADGTVTAAGQSATGHVDTAGAVGAQVAGQTYGDMGGRGPSQATTGGGPGGGGSGGGPGGGGSGGGPGGGGSSDGGPGEGGSGDGGRSEGGRRGGHGGRHPHGGGHRGGGAHGARPSGGPERADGPRPPHVPGTPKPPKAGS